MPYIAKHRRPELDKIVEAMSEILDVDGDLNYLLYAYCKRHVPTGYNALKNYCGELRQCATEIERVLLASHEDWKMKCNGDV